MVGADSEGRVFDDRVRGVCRSFDAVSVEIYDPGVLVADAPRSLQCYRFD